MPPATSRFTRGTYDHQLDATQRYITSPEFDSRPPSPSSIPSHEKNSLVPMFPQPPDRSRRSPHPTPPFSPKHAICSAHPPHPTPPFSPQHAIYSTHAPHPAPSFAPKHARYSSAPARPPSPDRPKVWRPPTPSQQSSQRARPTANEPDLEASARSYAGARAQAEADAKRRVQEEEAKAKENGRKQEEWMKQQEGLRKQGRNAAEQNTRLGTEWEEKFKNEQEQFCNRMASQQQQLQQSSLSQPSTQQRTQQYQRPPLSTRHSDPSGVGTWPPHKSVTPTPPPSPLQHLKERIPSSQSPYICHEKPTAHVLRPELPEGGGVAPKATTTSKAGGMRHTEEAETQEGKPSSCELEKWLRQQEEWMRQQGEWMAQHGEWMRLQETWMRTQMQARKREQRQGSLFASADMAANLEA
ncbi:hypothetical protein DACRYDRAFT_19153 [Dacryopinax primogenitus]|uniref:Uncharacterized protein n=1 Tax=Dacryopinax primogenitus (strain DJM 731) TaxID=1858805 RepID=M5FYZ4_DACPD|nr:uncharacterized protein DACRYDRAFT_19153 [Dacryopinax primogenitus]EJT96692.1 hypothetical protein DACRYDRAFT_19153 [Dacryopinax primogenitus]